MSQKNTNLLPNQGKVPNSFEKHYAMRKNDLESVRMKNAIRCYKAVFLQKRPRLSAEEAKAVFVGEKE